MDKFNKIKFICQKILLRKNGSLKNSRFCYGEWLSLPKTKEKTFHGKPILFSLILIPSLYDALFTSKWLLTQLNVGKMFENICIHG